MMVTNCLVACQTPAGTKVLYPVQVQGSALHFESGLHIPALERHMLEEDFEGPFIVFDEIGGPAWLFENNPFDWDVVQVVAYGDGKAA